jgi:hypothetical protein
MKKFLMLFVVFLTSQAYASPLAPTWSAEATTGAAMGYCLAKHPYQTIHAGIYTPDGFEIVAPPGVVGAVRRNFVYDRTMPSVDQGAKNSCKAACAQFGRLYGPTYKGYALRQLVAGGGVITSGIGDMASLAMSDNDYYLSEEVTAGIWSRGNTWHESDVAQADFCCCQVK